MSKTPFRAGDELIGDVLVLAAKSSVMEGWSTLLLFDYNDKYKCFMVCNEINDDTQLTEDEERSRGCISFCELHRALENYDAR